MLVSAHRDWIDLHSSKFILFLLAVRLLMNVFIMSCNKPQGKLTRYRF